jgi:hypothetical protein
MGEPDITVAAATTIAHPMCTPSATLPGTRGTNDLLPYSVS